mmetsp:Transcript_34813/g.76409  ORF Transcript_34813/g.76409 Transcript_34813/m.76409 type:complete len:89 (+) Transcript_34813:748-1014(+)
MQARERRCTTESVAHATASLGANASIGSRRRRGITAATMWNSDAMLAALLITRVQINYQQAPLLSSAPVHRHLPFFFLLSLRRYGCNT